MITWKYLDANNETVGKYDAGLNIGGGLVSDAEFQQWLAAGNTPEPYVDPPTLVPSVVSRAQARKALVLRGLFGQVQPAIDAIPDQVQRQLVQIDWDDSQTFERTNSTLMMLATALSLTESDLDNLFTLAGTL